MRLKVTSYVVIFFFLVLFLSLLNIQLIRGKTFKDLSDKNCIRLLSQMGARGRILDNQDNIIVDNRLTYDVMILPKGADRESTLGIDKVLVSVAKVLETTPQDLKTQFKKGFIASFAPVTVARNINKIKAMALEELKSELAGIIIQPYPQRLYPYGRLASHTIGYLNEIDRWRLTKLADYGYKTKDIVGFGGLEEKYDYYLRQEEGGMQVEVDHIGRLARVLGFKPPKNGKDMHLTLDLKIQKIVEDSLGERRGSVIIMDPYNGQIKAIANRPDFNPSIFTDRKSSSIDSILDNPEAPLVNRAISGLYPAGSVFKLVVATGALEPKKINLSKTFLCSGKINIGRGEFSCWDTHGVQNLKGGITHSCNIFFYRTGILLGAQLIHDYALKFGFSRVTSLDLPYETGGFVPNPLWRRIYRFQNWFEGDTANLAIGQGELLVTPLQITRMMAVFANRGWLVNPYIVKAIDGYNISHHKRPTRVAIKDSTIDNIRDALRSVVSDPQGTGNVLSNVSIPVAGKTGTAQVSRGQPHGWFVGFLPFKDPKFVICVFLENGGSGQASCVVAKQIIENLISEGLI